MCKFLPVFVKMSLQSSREFGFLAGEKYTNCRFFVNTALNSSDSLALFCPSHFLSSQKMDDLDDFKGCGPSYLVESGKPWSHTNSVPAAMACLVKAVYALDKDRSMVNMGLPPLAPDWHLSFNYKLVKRLHEKKDSKQIIGAVFKWSRRRSLRRADTAPKVVVALRGTIASGDTLTSDLSADLALLMLQLHTTRRFSVALREVKQAVAQYGRGRVCMAGHSLGAAVCLLVAETLAEEERCFIDAHLFNPPFPSFDKLKRLVGGLVAAFCDKHQEEEVPPSSRPHLRDWRPHLYVNTHDPICAGYVDYFQKANSNDAHGMRSRVLALFGREARPYHLIPCAWLHSVDSPRGRKAHGIKQWWSQDDQIHSRAVGLITST